MIHQDLGSPVLSPPGGPIFSKNLHSHHASFPIIAVAIIGILATGLLLVSYYVFVIKCCLNWHRIDLLGRLSASRRQRVDDHPPVFSPAAENRRRGLDEQAIRSIPVLHYTKETGDEQGSECSVCLNEFQETEKLRMIPNCGHKFHIDCIDVWLQNNANCPLCRNSISYSSSSYPKSFLSHDHHHLQMMIAPSTTPQDPISNNNHGTDEDNDEDYVVIEIGNHDDHPVNNTTNNQSLQVQERSISIRESGIRVPSKKGKFVSKVSSFGGDECIDIARHKDEQFGTIQPIRRSFSMDSAADRQLYLAVQEIVNRQSSTPEAAIDHLGEGVGSCSSRGAKRSFFSFGHGRGSRNAVQPVHIEP